MTKANKEGFFKKHEPFISFIFGLSTLISSAATVYLAKSIGDQQVQAQKIQFAPIFTFNKKYDIENGIYETEYLTIENQGYPVLNFDAELDTVIQLKRTVYQPKIVEQKVSLPIDYFSGKSGSNGGKGELTMFIGFKNLSFGKKIQDDIIDYNHSHSPNEIINYETHTIVKITYVDAIDEHHTKYFVDQKITTKEVYDIIKGPIANIPDLDKEELKMPSIIKRLERNTFN